MAVDWLLANGGRRIACAVAIALCLAGSPAAAQSVGSGSIRGTVTDESGAVLPGVTVTAKSPALLLPLVTTLTEFDGAYKFLDLPAGTYELRFDLSGFQVVIREGIRLNVGFVARIDVPLKIGAVAETLTVSGRSPVVDLSTTTVNNNFTQETLSTIPTTRQLYQVLAMTPGIFTQDSQGRVDVGGSQLGTQLGYRNYGTTDQTTPAIEGIRFRQDTSGASFLYDFATLEEEQIKTVAADAEVALPGTFWNGLVKSGGNNFRGSVFGAYENESIQSQNLDAELQAKGALPNTLRYVYDVFGELGGPVKQDKLWFYAAWRDQRRKSAVPGFVQGAPPGVLPGPIGDPVDGVLPVSNHTLKTTYQLSPRYRLVGYFARNAKILDYENPARFRPAVSTDHLDYRARTWKGELQGAVSDRFLVNFLVGHFGYFADRSPQPGTNVPGNPARMELTTGWYAGPYSQTSNGTGSELRRRWESSGSLTFLPKGAFAGKHSVKTGYFLDRVQTGYQTYDLAPSANFLEIFNNRLPFQVVTYNNPIPTAGNHLTEISGFVKDEWAINRRLTSNLGLRLEQYRSFVDPATKPAGQFGGSGSYPGVDILTWTALAPRVGLAFDVTGSGKTVAKGTYGWFNHVMGDTSFQSQFNKVSPVATTYRWHDLNADNIFDPGEVNLDTNGPDFVSQTTPGSAILNPDLRQPVTHEFSTSVERELMSNFSLRTIYVYKRSVDLFQLVTVGRPYSVWTVPIDRRDPGPDGVYATADDGGPVVLYDFPTAYRGTAFNQTQFVNRPADRNDAYHTIEFTLNKRLSNNWSLLASFAALKSHRYVVGVPQSPNDNFFPLDETWQRDWKVTASYQLPKGVVLAAFGQFQEGRPLQRTYIFRPTDNAGGTPLVSSGTITVPLEDFGATRLPKMNLLNARVSKRVALGGSRRLDLAFDIYNVTNTNAITAIVTASGPTFGSVNNFVPPRIARFGVTFNF